MLSIGNNRRAVGELNTVARTVVHHFGSCYYTCRPAITTEKEIANLHFTHGGPASRGRKWRVKGKRLTPTGCTRK